MENICSLGAMVALQKGNQIYKHEIQYAVVDGCQEEQIEQDKEEEGMQGAGWCCLTAQRPSWRSESSE